MRLWIPRYPESIQQILRVLALHKSLKASDISRITGFHKQTVYKGLAKLLEDHRIKINEKGINEYSLSDSVDPDQIVAYFESEDKYGMFTLSGEALDAFHATGRFRGTFFDFGFLPTRGVYGCRAYLESIPKSSIGLFRSFEDTLKKLHYRLEEIYWTIDTYCGSDNGVDFGVGVESFIKTISQEREERKAVINVSFVVQDWFGGYFGFLYNLQARWINQDLNEGVIDEIRLCVIIDKIPIGKEFALSWKKVGPLPFVEEYAVEVEKVIDTRVQFNQKNILGFVDRFGHEIVFSIPPVAGLPTKILARTRWANMTMEDLTSGKSFPIRVSRFKINPRYSIEPAFIRSRSPEIELICAVISED